MAQINSITGTIYDTYNATIANVTVNAFDKDLRTEQLVGNATTDAKGFYKINYDAEKFVQAEYKSCDILIRVFSPAGVSLGESPVYFNVTQDSTIDYKIGNTPYQGLAEFDVLVNLITPLLDKQEVTIAQLKEDDKFKDFTFLSGETGVSFDKFSFLPLAYTFATTTKTQPDIFYGLFRMGFPTTLDDIILVKSESIMKGLMAAIKANIISAKWEKELDKVIKNFNALSSDLVLKSNENQNAPFKKVINEAIPNQELQQTFVNTYLENESTTENFWPSLATQNGFTDGKVIQDTKNIFNINSLTGYEPALTSLLYKESKTDKDLTDLRGYAKFTTKDWSSRISTLVATGELKNFPTGIAGETIEEKTQNYATTLNELVKSLYPTSVFSASLNKDSANPFGDPKPDLKTFFINNPDFDLKTNKINVDFDASKLDGVTNKDTLKKELKNINRLYKITPQYEQVSALRDLGIGSATEIVQKYSTDQLAQKLADKGISIEESKSIYARALTIDKKSTAAVLAYKMRYDVPIYAITGGQPVSADYQSTFGDNILCDCDHCQSVYSPSAYFVDIMNFLNKKNSGAFTRLHNHRPDLIDILLTCENTNTPLPYIDLVNELLESIVVDQTTIAYQTKSTAAELAAYPQNILQTAYDKLKTSAADYQLPLDLSLETSRKLLDNLELKRQQILEVFFPKGTQRIYTDLSIAKEVLNLSDGDVNIINGTKPLSGITGASPIQSVLKETQLTYVELLQVLESHVLNPVQLDGLRSLQIVSVDPDPHKAATCDITKLILTGIDSSSLLKLIRFVRLQKKLEWSAFEVDRLLQRLNAAPFDLGADDFNNQILIPTANVIRFKNHFNITAQKAIAILSLIDAKVYIDHAQEEQPAVPSLYDQLFRNKAISNPIDPGFKEKAENLAGSITEHSSLLQSALSIAPDELNILLAGNNGLLAPVANVLTLINLSELYKRSSLASLLKLSIVDLFDLINIIGINPLQGLTNADQTLLFIDRFNFIKTSSFSLIELKYLLLNKESANAISPPTEFIASVLQTTQIALKKIINETGAADFTTDAAIRSAAEALVIDKFSSVFKTDHATTKIILDETVKFTGDTSKSYLTALLGNTFLNQTAPFFTVDASGNTIPALPDYFNSYLHANKIVVLVKKLKFNAAELSFITSHAQQLAIDALVNNTVPVPFTAFENLSSLIRLRNLWKLPSLHLLEALGIVLNNGANAKANFITAFSTSSSADMETLQYLLGDPANAASKGSLNLAFPDDYKIGENLLQLWKCISLIQNLGVKADAFLTAVQTNYFSFLTALLKSKYTETEWLKVIQPISDELRTRRRDALVAYLLNDLSLNTFRTHNLITDSSSLYEYLLIDVEMDACMFTSRIKQAISSVQLFVDRCLMNLEPDISLDGDFATQWNSWRKQYRVWEANRKVFLYPENWIEPELRDDKSPFFQELESKLRQNEVTEETAQDALQGYLEKLDAVANLEIIGIYPDELTGIIHLFGRTRAIAHQYFYRYQKKSVWSPWEKVEVDIEGDHILPVIWNNRLMLLWLTSSEKQRKNDTGFKVPAPGQRIDPAPEYLEVKLAWSEFKNGKWITKRISKEALEINKIKVTDHADGTIAYEGNISWYTLSSFMNDEQLFIRVLGPTNYHTRDTLGNYWGAFCFDGCHSAPSVRSIDNAIDGLRPYKINLSPGLISNQMFADEFNKDAFSLFSSGLYKVSTPNINLSASTLFNNTPGQFRLLSNHHQIERVKPDKFFYNNQYNNFYVQAIGGFRPPPESFLVDNVGALMGRQNIPVTELSNLTVTAPPRTLARTLSSNILDPINLNDLTVADVLPSFVNFLGKKYLFQTFYHPHVCSFIKTLNADGIAGLFKENVQNKIDKDIFTTTTYNPTPVVSNPFPKEKVDFDFTSTYSIYNWELFFHIPMLMATRLSQNQKFEEARNWFHYIFDPTKSSSQSGNGAERFWITKPFKNEILTPILSIEDLFDEQKNPDLQQQLDYWAQNPFKPHAVARLRLSAYMRTTIMKYIDNLIAWGDNLFKRDTIESINEAILLYVLAGNILGKKPERIPSRAIPVERSFATIQGVLDQFSNAQVKVQSFIFPSTEDDLSSDQSVTMSLFCIPKNDKLLSYWDTVYDRLFKIRHCMNIEGVVRQLPLFEPPIDPGLLVKATAMGLDLNSIMNDVNASLPAYRFQFMLQKSYELCNDVKGLGSELLSVLEKNDAEQLSLLRSSQEIRLLDAIRDIKVNQRDEAKENLNNIMISQTLGEQRRDYYSSKAKEFTNASEKSYFDKTKAVIRYQELVSTGQLLASVSYLLPEIKTGTPFTIGLTFGGANLGKKLEAASQGLNATANLFTLEASLANIKGGYERRQDEWKFQAQSAETELKQIEKQIAAAEIRLAIAEKELENYDLQIENSKAVDDFVRSKFTNAELYDYMVGQISSLYFQSYQMAYAVAKRTEKCMQYELGVEDTTYIQFGYWDSLKKGLLSGEKLQYDLRRLENAYLEKNKRELEITKHISMAFINPIAILQLKETGKCEVTLPEELFDLDFPGHYFRRIKSMSISIPCITGPYTSVNATLRLTKNEYRVDKNATDAPSYKKTPEEITAPGTGRFRSGLNSVSAIATSNAQNDSGVFELNFRDERYLPFEGAGATSTWSLELMNDVSLRQFDYETISDVILHLKYTASDGGNAFKTAAIANLKQVITDAAGSGIPLSILFDVRHEYFDEWHQFINSTSDSVQLQLPVSKDRLPFFAANHNVQADQITLFAKKKDPSDQNAILFNTNLSMTFDSAVNLFKAIISNISAPITAEGDYIFLLTMNKTEVAKLDEMFLVLNYKLT